MAIKKGNAPKTIPAKLELTGGGETNTLSLSFHNRKPSDFEARIEELRDSKEPLLPSLVVYVVKEWETDFSLSIEGVLEMEDERPGIANAIIQGFHRVRQVELQGN